MTFDEILEQVRDLLRSKGRVSYRALKRRFALNDEYLEDLKAEIIKAEQLASDEDGEVLVWTGGKTVASSQLSVASPQPPVAYTPRHLAQHILAEQAAMEARVSPRVSARPSPPSLPTSKAPPPLSRTSILKQPVPSLTPLCKS